VCFFCIYQFHTVHKRGFHEYPKRSEIHRADEWIRVEGNVATLGVTDYAQDQLSDVVFVEVTVAEGDSVKKGDIAATLESVKAAADVNFPVSGTVTEINEDLAQNPEIVNSDPTEQPGW
jgi:glycine cleavage system H protein